MGDRTPIEWAEATWNPVTGCTKVSAGCKFCYAERITERQGRKFEEIRLHPERLDQPLRWKRPRRIFVNSMSDLFHEAIPDEFIGRAFCVMAEASQHIFQILTKRHERMRALLSSLPLSFPVGMIAGDTLDNVWIGVSVENQEQADKRIPILLQTPAAVRFLSVEPLLGPVQLSQYLEGWDTETGRDRQGDPYPVQVQTHKIDWVIVGGESGGGGDRRLVQTEWHGKNAYLWVPKPTAVEWVRSIRDQCVAAGVPFFFKQWGGHTPKSGGRLLDGREWNEFPGRAR